MAEAVASKVRIGLMGTAGIASKNFFAVLASKNCIFTAVGSRTKERAEVWAREHAEKASKEGHELSADSITCHGSYEELLADSSVDVVYCPLPTALHDTWAVKVAEAGKGLLVEKPVALSSSAWSKIAAEFRKRCLPLMDGVMFMHHERLGRVLEILSAGADAGGLAGGATRISSGFSFPADDEWLATNIRTDPKLDALGALGDLGWYQVRFAQWAFGWDPPARVRAVCHKHVVRGEAAGAGGAAGGGGGGDAGGEPATKVPWTVTELSLPESGAVPTELTCTLQWTDGRSLEMDASFHHHFRQWVEVSGKEGAVVLDDFVIARGPAGVDITVRRGASPVKDHREVEASTSTETVGAGCVQEARMFDAMAGLWRACAEARAKSTGGEGSEGVSWPAAFWADISHATQAVMDAAMDSMRHGGAPRPLEMVSFPTAPAVDAGSWPWLMGPAGAK